jgi:DNA-binding response OmpR family regulator
MKKRLLLVYDDECVCDFIEERLSHLNAKRTGRSAAALMLARNQIYDLYIIDDRLPDGSGDNLCREIRKFDHNTPILLLTGTGTATERAGRVHAGATASLEKPFDFLQLESLVASLMRRAESASLKAAVAELEAIRDSIYDHLSELEARSHSATVRSTLAIERVAAQMSQSHDLALRAYSVFHAAGGSRGHFEKLWPAAIETTIHSCDSNKAKSMN